MSCNLMFEVPFGLSEADRALLEKELRAKFPVASFGHMRVEFDEFGEDGLAAMQEEISIWFDRWLKGYVLVIEIPSDAKGSMGSHRLSLDSGSGKFEFVLVKRSLLDAIR